jgi:predicted permease
MTMLDALVMDVRYCARSLRRSPGFSSLVILTLMVSIGANTALFSVLNAVLLRRLPVAAPDRLAVISLVDPVGGQMRFVYLSAFTDFFARQHSFEALTPYSGGGLFRTDVRSARLDAGVESATADSFALLGVRPFLGRLISSADVPSLTQGAAVAVISHRFWQRQFGGDPGAVNDTITIDGFPLTIVGVTPPEFHGLQVDGGADVMVPLAMLRQFGGDLRRPHRARNAIGRLRPGVTLEQARAEAEALWPAVQIAAMPAGLSAVDQADLRRARVTVESIATGFSNLRTRYANPLTVLVGFAALLLAIGCLNLSGLLVARAIARSQQLAVRVALGASRLRLVQQQLVESLLLSATGTALALPLAWWVSRMLGVAMWDSAMPRAMSTTPDARVFGAAAAMAIVTGALVGILPAWVATRHSGEAAWRSARSTMAGTGRSGKILVIAQVALSLMVLASAGLFARTLANLRANDATFQTRRLLFTRLWIDPDDHRKHDDAAYYSTLVGDLSQLSGVESVGLSMYFPSYLTVPVPTDGVARADAVDSGNVQARTEITSPRFFDTVGITRLQGRDFTWDDTARGAPVAIVNAALARALYPAGDAMGKHIRIGDKAAAEPIEIVGVVADAAVGNIREPHGPVVFRPLLQEPQRALVPIVHLRVAGDPKAAGDALVRAVASYGRHFVRTRMLNTLEEQVDHSLLQERLVAVVSSFFAGVTVLLACLGVYGLLAYAVARRTREIGVRIALGATRRSVLRMILGEGVVLAGVGVAVGIPCALAAGRFTRSLLYGLAPSDPTTIGIAAALFLTVGTAAGFWPAMRASSIDPTHALRQD